MVIIHLPVFQAVSPFPNQAQYFRDGNVADKVKAIEDKIANSLMDNPVYRNGFKTALRKKGIPKPKPKEKKKEEVPKKNEGFMNAFKNALQQDAPLRD